MNLLDTASLVVTPNGYKASKLYSIVPSDGSGDMTFARTGDTATRVNSSGLIESVLANKPRLDYLGSTCPKLLLEPQRSNRCLQSQDISSVYWTQTGTSTIVANASVAPDGTTTADSIQSANASTYNYITQIFSVSANSTYTFSVFVKKETTRTNFGGVSLYFLGGTGKIASVAFNEVAGTATNLTDSSITPIIKVDDYGTYWRYNVTVADNGSNTTLIAYYYPTISVNGTSGNVGTGSARTVWGFQLEAGSYATSYIPTTTASVTRNADSCYKTSATALIGQTEGTIYGEFSNTAKLAGGRYFSLSDGTGANRIDVYASTTSQIAVYAAKSSTAILNTNVSLTANSSFKFAIGYKAGSWVWYVNGVQIITSTDSNVPTLTAIQLSTNAVGDPSGEGVLFKSGALWKTRLTNQELATLTSL
jgi:hypothetical protein